ncbi:MAG: ABC transporter permease [Bacteroidales bacterium]|nr:ABC transporter permease [Bacteroidales bacterium]
MIKFLIKRIYYGLLVLLGVIIIIFFLFNVLPGDPARMMVGQRSDISTIEAIEADLGLNQPLYIQFFSYLNDLSPISIHNSFNHKSFWYKDSSKYNPSFTLLSFSNKEIILKYPYLKRSYQTKKKVTEIIATAFPNTALLAVTSMIFAFVSGVFLGVLCAVKKDTWFDKLALVFSVIGMSLPSFFAAVLIAWVFAYLLGDYTGLNMYGTMYSVDDMGNGEYLDLKNLILPAFTLGMRPLAVIIELTKNSMLDVLQQDYIRTAKAKGLSKNNILFKHSLKNAINPVITGVSGWLASLLAGAVFVEYIFDWKGMGVVIVEALEKYDFPVLMGSVLFVSVLLILINIFVDILYGLIDPRVRIN